MVSLSQSLSNSYRNTINKIEELCWVQCERPTCLKWRLILKENLLNLGIEPWFCELNVFNDKNDCSKSEEDFRNYMKLVEKSEYEIISSILLPFSIVWAKTKGYCKWPAMLTIDKLFGSHVDVDEDGDPIFYHVTYLGMDNEVINEWLPEFAIELYGKATINLKEIKKEKNQKWTYKGKTVMMAMEEADYYLSYSIDKRLALLEKKLEECFKLKKTAPVGRKTTKYKKIDIFNNRNLIKKQNILLKEAQKQDKVDLPLLSSDFNSRISITHQTFVNEKNTSSNLEKECVTNQTEGIDIEELEPLLNLENMQKKVFNDDNIIVGEPKPKKPKYKKEKNSNKEPKPKNKIGKNSNKIIANEIVFLQTSPMGKNSSSVLNEMHVNIDNETVVIKELDAPLKFLNKHKKLSKNDKKLEEKSGSKSRIDKKEKNPDAIFNKIPKKRKNVENAKRVIDNDKAQKKIVNKKKLKSNEEYENKCDSHQSNKVNHNSHLENMDKNFNDLSDNNNTTLQQPMTIIEVQINNNIDGFKNKELTCDFIDQAVNVLDDDCYKDKLNISLENVINENNNKEDTTFCDNSKMFTDDNNNKACIKKKSFLPPIKQSFKPVTSDSSIRSINNINTKIINEENNSKSDANKSRIINATSEINDGEIWQENIDHLLEGIVDQSMSQKSSEDNIMKICNMDPFEILTLDKNILSQLPTIKFAPNLSQSFHDVEQSESMNYGNSLNPNNDQCVKNQPLDVNRVISCQQLDKIQQRIVNSSDQPSIESQQSINNKSLHCNQPAFIYESVNEQIGTPLATSTQKDSFPKKINMEKDFICSQILSQEYNSQQKKNSQDFTENKPRQISSSQEYESPNQLNNYLQDCTNLMKRRFHFDKDIREHMSTLGRQIPVEAKLGSSIVDLYEMFMCVQEYGGYEQVNGQDMWNKIYFKSTGDERLQKTNIVKEFYCKYLLAYEVYLKDISKQSSRHVPRYKNNDFFQSSEPSVNVSIEKIDSDIEIEDLNAQISSLIQD